eukprot:630945-Pyramimonas_sp.AAC.1
MSATTEPKISSGSKCLSTTSHASFISSLNCWTLAWAVMSSKHCGNAPTACDRRGAPSEPLEH